jgi:hypothetical protein
MLEINNKTMRILVLDPILRLRVATPRVAYVVRFEKRKNIFFNFEKTFSLLQRWRCSCKFISRRIGSRHVKIRINHIISSIHI